MKPESISVEVEMHAYAEGAIRVVDVPAVQLLADPEGALDLVFKYGQNDFQPKPFPSVSVGDVIRYGGNRWLVMPFGFATVPEGLVIPVPCVDCGKFVATVNVEPMPNGRMDDPICVACDEHRKQGALEAAEAHHRDV